MHMIITLEETRNGQISKFQLYNCIIYSVQNPGVESRPIFATHSLPHSRTIDFFSQKREESNA